jgi:hypothetical protein
VGLRYGFDTFHYCFLWLTSKKQQKTPTRPIDGYVTSDSDAIADIYLEHKYVKTPEEACCVGIVDGGCDIDSGAVYHDAMLSAINQGLCARSAMNNALFNSLKFVWFCFKGLQVTYVLTLLCFGGKKECGLTSACSIRLKISPTGITHLPLYSELTVSAQVCAVGHGQHNRVAGQ